MGQVLFAPALAGCTSDDVTASAAQVLSGYTALTKDSNDDPISGTMANRGAWTSGSSGSGTIAIPAGYHNGSGYVDCTGAYNAGVTAADARANSSSTNYKSGYNSGYSAGRSQGQADVKANPGSYGLESGGSYQNGYNAGYSDCKNAAGTLACSFTGPNNRAQGSYLTFSANQSMSTALVTVAVARDIPSPTINSISCNIGSLTLISSSDSKYDGQVYMRTRQYTWNGNGTPTITVSGGAMMMEWCTIVKLA